ncbi:MAG TPA: methyltransferase domain-containing protein [Rhabdochlamydiaceae bacterium]
MNHIWKAEDYHEHSSAQQEAAQELLEKIHLKGHEHILDVGCGDGKITASLTKHVPNGSVLGIDSSKEMIDFAKETFPQEQYQNLAFSLQDAKDLRYQERFDLIFSSFALQWLPNLSLFFKGAYQSLKPSGYLAVTVPLGVSEALEQSIQKITALKEWSSYFEGFNPGWHFRNAQEWKDSLERSKFKSLQCKVVSQGETFSSRENFEEYVRSWFSYLKPLPEHLKEVFFKQIIDRYLEIEPLLKTGEVAFRFSRLDIVASKAIL